MSNKKGTLFTAEQLTQLRALNALAGDEGLPEAERRAALKAFAGLGGESNVAVGGIALEDIRPIAAYMIGLALALNGAHRVISLREAVEFRAELKTKLASEARHKV